MGKMTQDNPARYQSIWKQVLYTFFGWEEVEVDDWSSKFTERMLSEETLFYHEDPYYYIVPLCIPDILKTTMSPIELNALKEDIGFALRDFDSGTFMESQENWIATRERVEHVLHKHGFELPRRSPEE